MNLPNPEVDPYFFASGVWRHELEALREILLEFDLDEVLKWRKPTYTRRGSNVVVMMPLKATCALLFTKGALLTNTDGLLIQPGVNSQSTRQMRFTSVTEIAHRNAAIRGCVRNAIAVEEACLKIDFKKSADLVYPEEFRIKLDEDHALRKAFQALTPGRQRQYHIYFTSAKQAATRESRVAKALPLILRGSGLNDR